MKLGKLICCVFSCAIALKMAVSFLSFVLILGFSQAESTMQKRGRLCIFSWFLSQAKQGGRSEYRNVNLTLLKIKIDMNFCV